MSGLNLHVTPSPFTHGSRILKGTRSLAERELFDRIEVAAVSGPGLPEEEAIDTRRRVRRFPMGVKGGRIGKAFGRLAWMVRIAATYRNDRVACVNCHGLDTMLLGVWFKRAHGAALVYDPHELESHRNGFNRPLRLGARVMEGALIRQADRVIVVGDAIADWYRSSYRLDNVYVVRNVPDVRDRIPGDAPDPARFDLRARFGIPAGAVVFVYLGMLSRGRGIEKLLEAFSDPRLSPDRHVVFIGYGSQEALVRQRAATHPAIHFMPAVAPEHVQACLGGADVGLALIENTCLSYYYCLPNKFFECLVGGVPVIASDFPEMGAVIDRYGCGWKVDGTAEGLLDQVNAITPEALAERRDGARKAREELGWHVEERALLAAFDGLLAPVPGRGAA